MARRPRSDGIENRRAVMAATRALYREKGPGVPAELIADRAGVSRTTVARHFPTRSDLESALMDENTRRVEAYALEVRDDPDGMRRLFRFVLELNAEASGLVPGSGLTAVDAVPALERRVAEAFLVAASTPGRPHLPAVVDDIMVALRLSVGVSSPPPGLDAPARTRAWALLERAVFDTA